MTAAVSALVGRFRPDCRTFDARPIRMYGQPTHILPHLAAMYLRQRSGRINEVTDILMARDWAEISVVAVPGRTGPHHDWIPGYGNSFPAAASAGLYAGHIANDRPLVSGEWAYLWESAYGALHIYCSADVRWQHLATLPAELLRRYDRLLGVEIEARAEWVIADEVVTREPSRSAANRR